MMKNNKMFQGLENYLHKNLIFYTVTILFLCIGVVIGVYMVKYMESTEKNNLISFFLSANKNINPGEINKKYVFFQAIKNNIFILFGIWFLGLTILGAPIVLILDLVKGFTIGFTSSLVMKGLGAKGILFNLLVIFPQNVIYITCIIIASVIAIEFSLMILKNNKVGNNKGNTLIQIAPYSIMFLFIVGFMFVGFIIEGYISPNMLKIVAINTGCVVM